ncbi:hypothetical protein BGW42_007795 [Actinomortierella wolfii]|nr:hypothetical protein BGW42_007795 [Actinomortierella wolfii]
MLEVTRCRTTLFEWIGWSPLALEAGHESVLTRLVEPTTTVLARWIQGLSDQTNILTTASSSSGAWFISLQRLAYQVAAELTDLIHATIKGVENTPLFSSAPLSPPSTKPFVMPYFASFSSRWLISLENFPHEARVTAIVAGIFVGYSIIDLIQRKVYFPEYIDSLSSYIEHAFYIWVALRLVALDRADLFLLCSIPLQFIQHRKLACRQRDQIKLEGHRDQLRAETVNEYKPLAGRSTSVQTRPMASAEALPGSSGTFSLRTKSQSQDTLKKEKKTKTKATKF